MSNQPCQLVLRLCNDHSLYNNHNNNEIYASHALSQETKYTPQNIKYIGLEPENILHSSSCQCHKQSTTETNANDNKNNQETANITIDDFCERFCIQTSCSKVEKQTTKE